MTQGRMTLGPRDGTGYKITILRGFEDGTEKHTKKFQEYDCYGVDEIDVQDPWTSTGAKYSFIRVKFTNGEEVYLQGVITEVNNE